MVATGVGATCGCVSLYLIVRMWRSYRRESFLRKVFWSLILCVPLFGWLAYGGRFAPEESINTPCSSENWWGGSGD
jgi:hypothetical protein